MLQGEPVASISDNPVSATLPIALGSGTGKDEQRGSTSALIPQTGSTQPFNDDLQTQRKLAAMASMGDPIGDNNRQPFTNSSSNNNTFERVLERPLDYGTRKIVAENLQWNVDAVTKLKRPLIAQVPAKYRAYIVSHIPVDLPLTLTAKFIRDDGDASDGSTDGAVFWKRACLKRFERSKCDPLVHGGSWKVTFFELLVEEMIEGFVPEISSRDALVERLSLARDFVYRLNIEKLRPANWISAERPSLTTSSTSSVAISVTTADTKSTTTSHSSRTRDGSGKLTSASTVLRPATATSSNKPHSVSGSLLELKQAKRVPVKENEMRTEEANHVDMRTVLGELKNVLSITLQYGMNDCGMGFSWNLFGITHDDTFALSQAIGRTQTLESLDLRASQLDDEKCKLLCIGLKECKTLRKLNLSHNRIKDVGAAAIATMLAPTDQRFATTAADLPNFRVTQLNLSNNRIGPKGAVALGKALAINCTLKSLNLRLNIDIGDEGAAAMVQTLGQENYTLRELTLAGCQVGVATTTAIVDVIKQYGEVNARMLFEKEHPGATSAGADGDADVVNAQLLLDADDLILEDDEDEKSSTSGGGGGGAQASPGTTRRPRSKAPAKGKSGAAHSATRAVAPVSKGATSSGKQGTATRAASKSRGSAQANSTAGVNGRRTTNIDSALNTATISATGNPINRGKTPSRRAGTASNAQNESDSLDQSLAEESPVVEQDPLKQRLLTLQQRAISYPVGITHLDLSSNAAMRDDPCGKSLFDAVKVNKWVVRLDIRGTDIGEHYSKAITSVVTTNKDLAEVVTGV